MMLALLLAAASVVPVETLSTPDLACRARDAKGNVVRSQPRRALFRKLTGYPKGRPGFIVEHTIPLACGGCDVPSNMAWLPEAEHNAKTAWERKPCSAWFDGARLRQLVDAEAKR